MRCAGKEYRLKGFDGEEGMAGDCEKWERDREDEEEVKRG